MSKKAQKQTLSAQKMTVTNELVRQASAKAAPLKPFANQVSARSTPVAISGLVWITAKSCRLIQTR